MDNFVLGLNDGVSLEPSDNVFDGLWKEYERVILHSLVTSFGLDVLIRDQHGGDVDTINNVRKIGDDPLMTYKNKQNQLDYENRGEYDKSAYHSDERYKNKIALAKEQLIEGKLQNDIYVNGNEVVTMNNKTIPKNKQAQLDHIIAAKKVHNDPGRVLAGIKGEELANDPSNLGFTNAALNNNMKDKTPEEYILWCEQNPDKVNYNGKKGEPLPEDVKANLRKEYKKAKKAYEAKIAREYYTSTKFAKDTAAAAGKVGVKTGIKQVMGFVFLEVWYAAKEELEKSSLKGDLKEMLTAIGQGIKKGVENAKIKYKELLAKFEEGIVSGALASITTTICNIFFTTAKNLVKAIRQIYASVVEAGKVLLFNPDDLMFGDRIKKATVIMATGASVLVGTAVGELVGKTPLGAIPVVGDIATVFVSTLVSGLISCTLLMFMDRSKLFNSIIKGLNGIASEANNYKEIADEFERLAAKIAEIDIEMFAKETSKYNVIANKINNTNTEEELNAVLLEAYKNMGINIPWDGNFDEFMSNKSNRLVFD